MGGVAAHVPVVISAERPLRACLTALEEQGGRHLVVRHGDGRLGLVHDYQLLRLCRQRGARRVLRGGYAQRRAGSLAVTATCVHRSAPVSEALRVLAAGWEDAVVVVEGHRPMGVFTVEDALAVASGWLTPWWTVGDGMTRVRWGFPECTPVRQALRAMWAERLPHVLICDGQRVTGAVEIQQLIAIDPERRARLECFRGRGKVLCVSRDTRLSDAVRALQGMGRRCLPVVGEGRRPEGIFAANGVLRALGRSLERAA